MKILLIAAVLMSVEIPVERTDAVQGRALPSFVAEDEVEHPLRDGALFICDGRGDLRPGQRIAFPGEALGGEVHGRIFQSAEPYRGAVFLAAVRPAQDRPAEGGTVECV